MMFAISRRTIIGWALAWLLPYIGSCISWLHDTLVPNPEQTELWWGERKPKLLTPPYSVTLLKYDVTLLPPSAYKKVRPEYYKMLHIDRHGYWYS